MTSLHHIHEAGILYNLGERSKLRDQRPYTFMVSFYFSIDRSRWLDRTWDCLLLLGERFFCVDPKSDDDTYHPVVRPQSSPISIPPLLPLAPCCYSSLTLQGTILIAVNPLRNVPNPEMSEYMDRPLNPETPHPYAIAEVNTTHRLLNG